MRVTCRLILAIGCTISLFQEKETIRVAQSMRTYTFQLRLILVFGSSDLKQFQKDTYGSEVGSPDGYTLPNVRKLPNV